MQLSFVHKNYSKKLLRYVTFLLLTTTQAVTKMINILIPVPIVQFRGQLKMVIVLLHSKQQKEIMFRTTCTVKIV